MAEGPQSFENHSRIVPMYHYVATAIFGINLLYALVRFVRWTSIGSFVGLLLSIGIVIVFWYMRVFPLAVQDRVIRLEERLRIERLCPDLRGRIDEFTVSQLVALRFASDEELPELAKRVLDEKITSRTEIKKAIRTWRPDYVRA